MAIALHWGGCIRTSYVGLGMGCTWEEELQVLTSISKRKRQIRTPAPRPCILLRVSISKYKPPTCAILHSGKPVHHSSSLEQLYSARPPSITIFEALKRPTATHRVFALCIIFLVVHRRHLHDLAAGHKHNLSCEVPRERSQRGKNCLCRLTRRI